MRRRTALSLIAACALGGCAHQSGPPVTAGMGWSLAPVEGEGLKLAFGRPDSDDVLVMLRCQPRSGAVTVSVSGASASDPALRLASGRVRGRYAGQATPSLGEGTLIEAVADARDPVLARFAARGDLTVSAAGHRTTLPADPARAARFVRACRVA
jgi:hypothetical protein